jgi:hypothetical protein
MERAEQVGRLLSMARKAEKNSIILYIMYVSYHVAIIMKYYSSIS